MATSLLFAGGTLVEPGRRAVRRADLLVTGPRIAAVGDPGATGAPGAVPGPPEGVVMEVVDCAGKLILPGLVLGHTHLYSALALGMPSPQVAPRNFPEILERVWWRLDRALDDETVALSAEVGAALAARAGITTLFDHHASPAAIDGSLDRVAGAIERVGLRGALCYEVTDRGGPELARAGLDENDRFLGSLDPERRPRLRGMVGAHAGFTLGHDTTVALADLTVKHGVGLHIHVAEDACDARHLVPAREASIVDWLDAYRLLGPRALLAHCVHVDDAGAERIAAAGAFVAHNARSNMNNAVGYARPSRLGPRAVLGTDGIGADVFAEAQAAFFAARDHGHTFDPLSALARGYTLAATTFDRGLGRLEPGCPADLTLLDYSPPTPLDGENLFGHLIFGMSAAHVSDVFVQGDPVLRDRKLVRINEQDLLSRAREAAPRLWSRMAALQ